MQKSTIDNDPWVKQSQKCVAAPEMSFHEK